MVPALQPPPALRWILISTGLVGVAIITAALLLLSGQTGLPDSSSDAGRALLRQYNDFTHGLVLSGMGLTIAGLWYWGQHASTSNTANSTKRPRLRGERLLRWCRQHPLLLILFSSYGVAMVKSTTGFYPELQGWLHEIQAPPLLDNFQFRNDLINETMRANSFRFFPLAHQDLHVLSWLTPYVKVWAAVSAIELIAVVLVTNQVATELTGINERPGQLWLISLLLLFHPATGWGFFQLIYCERLLTLLFAIFIAGLQRHQAHESRSSFAVALSCALAGIFVKDIGIVLFFAPPAFTLLLAATGRPGQRRSTYALEWWLVSLSFVALAAYGVLSLIPSLYAAGPRFDTSDRFTLVADWRLIGLLLFTISRWLLIARKRCQANLVDGLNLAALSYATGLWLSVGYPYESFWTLPVQLVTVLNLAFIWSHWLAPALGRRTTPALVGAIAIGISAGLLATESGQAQNFQKRINKITKSQQKWEATFEQLDHLLRERRAAGQPRNLIFMRSWFGAREYRKLPYDRLIELDMNNITYTVIDGINAGHPYEPKPGDLLANIDKRKLSDLGPESDRYIEIYRFSTKIKYGAIYERKP